MLSRSATASVLRARHRDDIARPAYARSASLVWLALFVFVLATLSGCGGSSTSLPQQTGAAGSIPIQPPPANSNQFSMFGFTWAKHASRAPGGGTFSHGNAEVSKTKIVLTLHEDATGSDGAEIATVTPLSYGSYTFTYYQDGVQSGSIASGFSYLHNSATEIDVEQQGQYPYRWDFTNYTDEDTKQSSFVDGFDATVPHSLRYVWQPDRIEWYIDGQLVAVHTQHVPLQQAPFLFNFWGADNPKWGGVATAGTRHMVITSFSYQPR